jgi:hypothetical protein
MAAADVMGHFGWGYRPQDILLGFGMAAFGVLFWFAWGWMFKLLGWLTDIFVGPEPSE